MTLLNLYTTAEAAEIADLTVDAIRHAIWRGFLPAQKIGRDWFIHGQDLQEYLDGRPGSRRHYRRSEATASDQ